MWRGPRNRRRRPPWRGSATFRAPLGRPFDNRRLWVMKHAGMAHVPVVWAASPNSANQQGKLTAPGGEGSRFITVMGGTDKELKGLTPQKPDIDDPTIHKLRHYQYW